jgi:hypothetical protein
MGWTPYKPCCETAARTTSAPLCNVCGHPLLRCHRFAECARLLAPAAHCPDHAAPALMADGASMGTVRAHERLDLPLMLGNPTRDVSMQLRELRYRHGQNPWRQADLPWRKVEPATVRPLSLDLGLLEHGGSHAVQVLLVIRADFGDITETYAFIGEVRFRVGARSQGQQVVQHIHLEGATLGTGATGVLQTGHTISNAGEEETRSLSEKTVVVALQRADACERDEGLRGYPDGVSIPRSVVLRCEGFPRADAPPRAYPFLKRHWATLGRERSERDPDRPGGNDVSLRAYDPRSGALRAELSMEISRRHFELGVSDGRLLLRNRGRRASVNGRPLGQGQTVTLRHGDVFNPFHPPLALLDVEVAFESEDEWVHTLVLRRQHPVPDSAPEVSR